jgi:hypothetical protein
MVEFSEWPTSWKLIPERMIGDVVIFAVDVMYVVLSKAEKHVSYVGLVGGSECMTLYSNCRTNRGRYNRVNLCLILNAVLLNCR